MTRRNNNSNAARMPRAHIFMPIAATLLGIALLSWMDAFMKAAAIAVGAYSALLIRALIGTLVMVPVWRARGGTWPGRKALKLHVIRSTVIAAMAFFFFFALVRLPIAQALAISFISPLFALYLAALLLGERIERKAVVAAVMGLIGVVVILAGKIGEGAPSREAWIGIIAVLVSAALYAWNLILTRQQALVAGPVEVAAFQNAIVTLLFLVLAPFLLVLPDREALVAIGVSAALSTTGGMLLSWAYGRSEAQVLVPIEYTGFLWAALFGWLYFGEIVTVATIAGAVLIVIGCLVATRRRPEQSSV